MPDRFKILDKCREVAEDVILYRRHIHRFPELSFEEHSTCEYISSVLTEHGIAHRKIAGTGVLAIIEAGTGTDDTIVLRADIDALPITEMTEAEYGSENPGVMHACGHDMHTAALLGALTVLKQYREVLDHNILGLFQPGEELCPGGASLVLKEKPFEKYNIKAFVGQHTETELETGMFGFRAGKYMASSDEIHLTVKGSGGHGGIPQKLRDPVVATASIITALQQISSRNADPFIPTVLSIGRVIADGATNIIPDQVSVKGTFRTFDEEWRGEAKERIAGIIRSVSKAYGVEDELIIAEGYPCVHNDPELTSRAAAAMEELFGQDKVVEIKMKSSSEDFGFYTRSYPSVFYRFGVHKTGAARSRVHTATFDPDEDSLFYAVAGLVNLGLCFGTNREK